ncbi:MAG TPA: MFS transporter [Rhizomicrobium sp.]|jgi:SHS family lactate transporter-like MFS transporter|nr:MFS transporter [Rhizomicrobium sp.]
MAIGALKGWTAAQKHVVAASYLGWTLDAFDFLLLTLVAKDVAAEFATPATSVGWALLFTLAARPVGAFLFGRLADRFGRRPVLQLDILLYSALAFASALSPNITVFLILRGLFGVAMGGEWGIGSSLTMEHIRPESRGFVSGLLQTGYPTGSLIAGAVSALLLPAFGWRICVMASALPALLVFYIRRHVPESPVWKPGMAPKGATLAVVRRHWGLALFAMVMMTGFNSFSHGTQDFYPNFLRVQLGFGARAAGILVMAGAFGAILGGLAFGSLSERIGRRRAITISALLFLPVVPFWVYSPADPLILAASMFACQFFVQGAWGVVPAHLNELSPPEARGTFPGFVYQAGNFLASGIGLLQTSLVVDAGWRYADALALVGVCAAVLIAVSVNLGPEARGVPMAGTPR